ncbi:hypothetical protein TNCV_2632691 [Trichonephila clavipes]|nr:hypothetical protein TNCV_2632691 [Trichonephila clavipes]
MGTTVRKIGGGRSSKITAVEDQYIVLQVKRARYQSANAIVAQQHGNKCHGFLLLDVFTKVAYSPAIMNAASAAQFRVMEGAQKLDISSMESCPLYR